MAHSYKYFGLSLGKVLSEHGGDLAMQLETGSWCSFHPTKSIRVKLKGPGIRGFVHPSKKVSHFGAELFDSKSDAEDDALAKLLHNTAHTGQLSTLPAKRRAAVEKRYDEIQKWTENAKPKKKGTGGREGSGKGYTVVKKRGGGTALELVFTPAPDFTLDRKKGLKVSNHVKDTKSNRDKIEEEHAQNKTVQRRKKLASAPEPDARRKFGDDRTNSSSESSPEASRPAAKKKPDKKAPQAPRLDTTAAPRRRAALRPAPTTGGSGSHTEHNVQPTSNTTFSTCSASTLQDAFPWRYTTQGRSTKLEPMGFH